MFKLLPVSPQPLSDWLRSGLLGRAGITGQGQAGGATKLGSLGREQAWSVNPNPGLVGGQRETAGLAAGQDAHGRTKHQPAQPGCHRCCNMRAQDRGGGVTSQ